MGYVIVALVAVAVAVFAMQNTAPVEVSFLIWGLARVPVAALVLASLGAGIVIVGIPLWFQLWRVRRRARTLEDELAAARAVQEARVAAAGVRPGARPPVAGGGAPPTG
jgi:uncharacterized integral membrane protein